MYKFAKFGFLVIAMMSIGVSQSPEIYAGEHQWIISFIIYSGREDPRYRLNEVEIATFEKMLNDELKSTLEAKGEEQGRIIYGKSGNSMYRGLFLRIKDNVNQIVEEYTISGKYVRIRNVEKGTSVLYKMHSESIEDYLIDLGKQKDVIGVDLSELIEKGKRNRKE